MQPLREGLSESIQLVVSEDLPDAPAFQVLVSGRPTEEQLSASPALESLVIPYVGIPVKTRLRLLELPNLSVYNIHHNAQPTAEMAVGLLIAAARQMVAADQDLRRGDWTRRYSETDPILLGGKRAMVLGLGAIGERVARTLEALGMDVVPVARRSREGVHAVSELPGLLPRVQALVVCAPATPETDGLIGEAELGALPAGALVVNVGRASVIDEAALFAGLKNGHLGGAGLDVWYQYPESEEDRTQTLPSEYAFHELENVVLSPHRAGHVDDNPRQRAEHLITLLHGLAGIGPRPCPLDLEVGY